MLSYDQQWGSKPKRSHNMGFIPWNEANKVPTLSQWFHDMIPFYSCCFWQEEQAVGCETLRFERRPSQDCVGYQSPYVGTKIKPKNSCCYLIELNNIAELLFHLRFT